MYGLFSVLLTDLLRNSGTRPPDRDGTILLFSLRWILTSVFVFFDSKFQIENVERKERETLRVVMYKKKP